MQRAHHEGKRNKRKIRAAREEEQCDPASALRLTAQCGSIQAFTRFVREPRSLLYLCLE